MIFSQLEQDALSEILTRIFIQHPKYCSATLLPGQKFTLFSTSEKTISYISIFSAITKQMEVQLETITIAIKAIGLLEN